MKRKPRSNCLFCNKECKRSTAKFCGTECYGKYRSKNNIRIGGPKRTVFPRPCEFCKQIFEPVNYTKTQKFCSKHCMGKARADFCSELGKKWKNKPKSPEHLSKMSEQAVERWANGVFNKGQNKGGFRKDLNHYVRSTWEANVARILKFEKYSYKYENKIFELKREDGSVVRYIPDFELSDRFIEVKGWWNSKSKLKKKLMSEQFPDIKIEYISEDEYTQLQKYYSDVIPEWE